MRRDSMQVAVENILKAHGQLTAFQSAMDSGQLYHIRLEQAGFDPLVIEVIGKDTVSVAHYFKQNGDAMQDPEIVFGRQLGIWWPTELTQAPMGVYRAKFFTRNGREYVDTRFHGDVMGLVNPWARNLRFQGWDKARLTALNPWEVTP